MADRLKLAQGLRNLPAAAREDLAGREQDIQRGKTVELLRRAGKEMYENPAVNTAIGLSPVLGDIQAGVEAYRSAQAGDWGNAGLNAAGMLPFIPMLGKTVWHGSPHTFDKFDMSKIGTGEGAQAYGHGLYLAEARPTAEEYRSALTGNHNLDQFNPTVDGQIIDTPVTKAIIRNGGNPSDFIKSLEPKLKLQTEKLSKSSKEEILPGISDYDMALMDLTDTQKMIDEANSYLGKTIKNEPLGSLYKVDLPDEQIAKMLDWDKPLSEQPEIMQTLRNSEAFGPQSPSWAGAPEGLWEKNIGARTGSDFYLKNKWADDQAKGSAMLYEAGIPGIQYLDQASRGAGDGTRNYVVFSDEIPQILERNGTPLGNAVRNFEAPQAQALREAEEYGQKMLGLPPGNTPIERAVAGGYVDPTYHGTKTDVPEFDLSYHGTATDPGDFGEALYSSANPNIAGNYAETTMRGATTEGANIMPLMTRQGNQMQVEGMKGMEPLLEKAGGIENWFDLNPQQQAQIAKDMGYTSVRDFGYPQTANYDLGDVRSKFAAFDPRYFGKPGLMLGAGGLGVYGALQGEDEYQ